MAWPPRLVKLPNKRSNKWIAIRDITNHDKKVRYKTYGILSRVIISQLKIDAKSRCAIEQSSCRTHAATCKQECQNSKFPSSSWALEAKGRPFTPSSEFSSDRNHWFVCGGFSASTGSDDGSTVPASNQASLLVAIEAEFETLFVVLMLPTTRQLELAC